MKVRLYRLFGYDAEYNAMTTTVCDSMISREIYTKRIDFMNITMSDIEWAIAEESTRFGFTVESYVETDCLLVGDHTDHSLLTTLRLCFTTLPEELGIDISLREFVEELREIPDFSGQRYFEVSESLSHLTPFELAAEVDRMEIIIQDH